jgi:hypothetical protein
VRGLAQEALERALEAERTGTAHPLDEAAAAGPARVEARPSGLIVARSLPSRSGMLTEE